MTVVSSKDFAIDQEKYFDLALDGNVCIKRGVNMFYLIYSPEEKQDEEDIIFQPDDELRSCISMDEVRARTRDSIHHYFLSKQ